METMKLLRMFYTAWMLIAVVMFLTHCKNNPNVMHQGNSKEITEQVIIKTDSELTTPTQAPPATTSVAVNNNEPKKVKLIYLK